MLSAEYNCNFISGNNIRNTKWILKNRSGGNKNGENISCQ